MCSSATDAMFQQDTLLRQVQQLAAVLAHVLFRKRTDQPEEAQAHLAEGLERALGSDLTAVRRLTRDEVLAMCAPGGALAGEASVALAALLAEDTSAQGRERAVWLLEHALASGEAVPFDVHDRLAALRGSPAGPGL